MAIPYDPPPDERTPQRDPQSPRRDAPRTPEEPRDPNIHKPPREAPGQNEPDERGEREPRPDKGRKQSMRRAAAPRRHLLPMGG